MMGHETRAKPRRDSFVPSRNNILEITFHIRSAFARFTLAGQA